MSDFGAPVLATVITADTEDLALGQARQARWEALSEASRQSFYWPDPGDPRCADRAFSDPAPSAPTPPPTFCLGWFQPDHVDHLELRGTPQTRTQYQRLADGTWTVQAVNP